jgi:iron complex outermembrane recepter protein
MPIDDHVSKHLPYSPLLRSSCCSSVAPLLLGLFGSLAAAHAEEATRTNVPNSTPQPTPGDTVQLPVPSGAAKSAPPATGSTAPASESAQTSTAAAGTASDASQPPATTSIGPSGPAASPALAAPVPTGTGTGVPAMAGVPGAGVAQPHAPSAEPINVTVVGSKPSSRDGYRTEEADLGPLGERSRFTLPVTVYGVPSGLLQNQLIHETHDLMQFVPSLQMEARFGMEFGPPIIRGFEVDDNSESTRIDGMNVRADTALPMDLYERYDVLTGPAGALYGPTYAGGMINGVLKRPTEKRFEHVALEFQGATHGEILVDAGGRVGHDGMFGYRINAVHGDGKVYAPRSNLNRDLGSVAFDVRLPTRTVLEVLASDYRYNQFGYPGGFTFGGSTGSTHLPAPLDPTTNGLGAPWAGVLAHTRLLELGVTQSIARGWHAAGAILHQIADREFHNTLTHTLSSDAGNYATTYRQAGSRGNVLSNKLYLNGELKTGGIRQELALGSNGFRADAYSRPQTTAGTLSLGTGTLDAPTAYGEPAWIGPGTAYKTSRTTVQTLVLSDTVHLGEPLAVLLGASLGWIHTRNYNATGITTSKVEANAQVSTMAGLAYQPRSNMTVYGNYADSIQPGETASACSGNASRDLTNCGQTLDPERSHQFEVGYRYQPIDKLELSVAGFLIKRPFAYADAATNTFAVVGSQVNRGIELLARGNPLRDVTVVSGLTILDPKLEDTPSDQTRNKQVVGIPAVQGNVLVEYRLSAVPGLALTGSVHGRNHFPGNPANSTWARGFAIADANARYTLPLQSARVSVIAGVDNIFDTRYWASVRGSLSGDPVGSSSAFLGSPRLFKCGLGLEL